MAAPTSPDSARIELISHDVIRTSESDIYGVSHDLGFESGDVNDPRSYSMYVASLTVGGMVKGGDQEKFITRYSVKQIFPPSEGSGTRGILVSGDSLDEQQVAAFSKAKVQALSLEDEDAGKEIGQ